MVGDSSGEGVTTVARSDVTVTRSLTKKNGGIVGVLSLESERTRPVLVHVVDRFPEALPVEEARFKPGTEPNMGEIDQNGIEIEQRVDDEVVKIGFGIILEKSIDEVRMEPPHISAVRSIDRQIDAEGDHGDGDRDADPTADGATADTTAENEDVIYRGASTRTPLRNATSEYRPSEDGDVEASAQSASATGDETAFEGSLQNGELAAAALLDALDDVAVEDGASGQSATEDTATDGQSTRPQQSEKTSTAESDPTATEALSAHPADAEESPNVESEATSEAATEKATSEAATEQAASETATEQATSEAATEQATSEAATEQPISEAATEQATSEAATESDDHDRPASETIPRSFELRLDRLSARVEEFTTYATALEAIIDDYGTGTEIVDDLDSRLERVESQHQSLEADLETIREERDQAMTDVRDEIDRTQTRIDNVASDIRTTSERLDDVVEEIDDRLDSLEDTVGTLSTDVESMDESLESIQGEIDSLASFRRSLAEISSEMD